ncbi:MAG: sensor signal transduction histidine kinase [Chloroflexi bacterium]|nr:sensor signal transduction histidine kinase [Chloroflexota bacterium]
MLRDGRPLIISLYQSVGPLQPIGVRMFGRIQWRIAASFLGLLALVLVGLGFQLSSLVGDQGTSALAAALASVFALAVIPAIALSILLARATAQQVERSHAFSEMEARLHGHISTIDDERARLRAVVSHLVDGLVIVDRDGLVRLVNPAASRLLDLAPGWAEGRPVVAVLRDHELAGLVSKALAAGSGPIDSGRPLEIGPQIVDLVSGTQRRSVQAIASRIPGADGTGDQALLVLQDVTELKRVETVRREFVANVSHELRTPIASIKALVETLEAGALDEPETARDFLSRMGIEVDGLAQLVEELLELSRVESGQVEMRFGPFDAAAIVRGGAERLRPQAERQGVRLVVNLPEGLPRVRVDPERIQQVIVNLVHNAVKFTPPGGTVTVNAEQRAEEVVVTVADTGVGIDADVLPRLFERFYKAERARASGGTGLGLAIVKHVVQSHGGRIWAESAGEGRGATFTFTLPVAT